MPVKVEISFSDQTLERAERRLPTLRLCFSEVAMRIFLVAFMAVALAATVRAGESARLL